MDYLEKRIVKWFLMAIMTMVYNGDQKDTFVWTNPIFDSKQQCVDYVKDNNQPIYFKLMENFPNDKLDRLLCVRQDKLEKFFKEGPVKRGDKV